MRWKGGRRSNNVEDRRGEPRRSAAGGAGLFLLLRLLPRLLASKVGRVALGIGAVVLMGAHFLGVDVLSLLNGGPKGQQQTSPQWSAEENELAELVSVVLADTEAGWSNQFQQLGQPYKEPTLVIFSGSTASACGAARSAMGPFYCPADQTIYVDLIFYRDLKNRHGAPGDFAQAYVIAHEVGHHVQTLLGTSAHVHSQQQRLGEAQANELSVRLELQADCFAGLWAHSADAERQFIEPGDIDEALVAAAAIGDDRLQTQSQGYAQPESFTHGTSAQRSHWFKRGYERGTLASCDTFAVSSL